jgi:hypothetical protein
LKTDKKSLSLKKKKKKKGGISFEISSNLNTQEPTFDKTELFGALNVPAINIYRNKVKINPLINKSSKKHSLTSRQNRTIN